MWIGRLTDGAGEVWRIADVGCNFHRAARGPGSLHPERLLHQGLDDRTEPATT